jgi:septal ring factor EnvC (AmiA/AmiB activator)
MMKTTTLTIAVLFCNFLGTAQVTQDSINKLQEDINKSQASINKRQREVNALQKSLDVEFRTNDESENLVRNILNDLMAMKIIDNKDVVAFSISTDKMEVNNKRQPDAVLETFKSKYHIVKGYSIVYAKAKDSISTSITR